MVLLLLQNQPGSVKESKVLPNNNLLKPNYDRRKLKSVLYALTGHNTNLNSSGKGGAPGLLLCCVCHEQNTTYRYEVVYKTNDKTLSFNTTNLYAENKNDNSLLQITDDSGIHSNSTNVVDDNDDHQYYNFPPRHPRHGHLKWTPVYTPILTLASKETKGLLQINNCSIKTYPDYPVHLQTTTLRRAAAVIKSGKRNAMQESLIKVI
jgi:hypothetical protein